MGEWWAQLEPLARWFYGAAAFFSIILIWQLILSLVGLAGGEDFDVDADADADVDAQTLADRDVEFDSHPYQHIEDAAARDEIATVATFKVLTFRSVIAFCTLFAWGAALYLTQGQPPGTALGYAALWGGAGMLVVAGIVHLMGRLTETGTPQIATAMGRPGRVYLNVPADGQGEVRVLVSGAVTLVKARGEGGRAIPAGQPVRVIKILDRYTVEVRPSQETKSEGEQP
jgi:hypothetical protein